MPPELTGKRHIPQRGVRRQIVRRDFGVAGIPHSLWRAAWRKLSIPYDSVSAVQTSWESYFCTSFDGLGNDYHSPDFRGQELGQRVGFTTAAPLVHELM